MNYIYNSLKLPIGYIPFDSPKVSFKRIKKLLIYEKNGIESARVIEVYTLQRSCGAKIRKQLNQKE